MVGVSKGSQNPRVKAQYREEGTMKYFEHQPRKAMPRFMISCMAAIVAVASMQMYVGRRLSNEGNIAVRSSGIPRQLSYTATPSCAGAGAPLIKGNGKCEVHNECTVGGFFCAPYAGGNSFASTIAGNGLVSCISPMGDTIAIYMTVTSYVYGGAHSVSLRVANGNFLISEVFLTGSSGSNLVRWFKPDGTAGGVEESSLFAAPDGDAIIYMNVCLLPTGKVCDESTTCPLKELDFADLADGDFVTSYQGITISARKEDTPFAPGPRVLNTVQPYPKICSGVCPFNSCRNCGDEDLGAPNQHCEGSGVDLGGNPVVNPGDFAYPGVGTGGSPLENYESSNAWNCLPQGKVLIVDETEGIYWPDDNVQGGSITFHFPSPVGLGELVLLDVDWNSMKQRSVENRVTLEIDGVPENPIITTDKVGDNGVYTLNLYRSRVTALTVKFKGSGSITYLRYFNCDDPLTPSEMDTIVSDRTVKFVNPLNLWTNRYNMVHVVQTKFMQHQSSLVALGRARLDLFANVAIPSIIEQSTNEFLWIVWTDPSLNSYIRDALVYFMEGIENAVVIAYAGRILSDFRSFDIETVQESMIWWGSLDKLKDYHKAAQTRRLIDTRLDADDALAPDLIANIQSQIQREMADASSTEWRVLCTEKNIEWRYYNDDRNSPQLESIGRLVDLQHNNFCINSGLTVAYECQADIDDLPNRWQCIMHEEVVPCISQGQQQCRARIEMAGDFAVFRPRTPAGVGLRHVYPNFNDPGAPSLSQEDAWMILEREFPVSQAKILEMRARLAYNEIAILQDAIIGACSTGFPCKPLHVSYLQTLLANAQSSI